jgi:hypothetical protein
MGFALSRIVLISRCAWHRRYHGYTKLLGISSWWGLHVSFTDGICHKCAARVRADHLRARFDRGASTDRRDTAWMPGLAAMSLSIVVALVLVARPTHELPPLPPVVSLMPPPVAVEPPRVVEPSATAPAPQPAAPAAARVRTTRPVVSPSVVVQRASFHERTSFRWTHPSAMPRLAISLSSLPSARRIPTPRDTTQSP